MALSVDSPFDNKALQSYFHDPNFLAVYGSRVFQQTGVDSSRSIVDLIVGIRSTREWHRKNLAEHPQDYTVPEKKLGLYLMKWIQYQGGGINYRARVSVQDQLVKYGTISREDLLRDLREWEMLYVAGRLQKPTLIVKSDPEIEGAMQLNLMHALRAALLTLPSHFTEKELYETITGFSYRGDVRMWVSEDPKKVERIVGGSLEHFKTLYRGAIERRSDVLTTLSEGRFEQDISPEA
ncbi:hypothetical protein COY07_04455 [Candidatus Peregrinibacteria bacterium CG_4_10_14_0_2_um_filter_43_11]|nr:MAG: hypothetical protein COY07_04455 [Candidatus Peregrinibacteria bacterium CG_4_10_14_0_2_um_filter_43_11]